jgi:hypothetical protein
MYYFFLFVLESREAMFDRVACGLQHNKYYLCFVFIYNIYHAVIYFYIFFLFLNKLFQNYVLNFIYHTSSNIVPGGNVWLQMACTIYKIINIILK